MTAHMSVAADSANQNEEIARVFRGVEALCRQHDVPFSAMCDINVAIDEALSNVLKHETQTASRKDIDVKLDVDKNCFRVRIESYGAFFDSAKVGKPTDLKDNVARRATGGLGIYLAKRLMSAITCRREGDKNVMLMEKRLEK